MLAQVPYSTVAAACYPLESKACGINASTDGFSEVYMTTCGGCHARSQGHENPYLYSTYEHCTGKRVLEVFVPFEVLSSNDS